MLVAGIIPDLVAITIVALFIPESPRFLLYQNKMDELAEVLRSIGAFNSREEELLDGGKCVPLGACLLCSTSLSLSLSRARARSLLILSYRPRASM